MIDFWVVYVLMFVNQTCKSPTGLPLQILEESAGNTLQLHPLSPRVASEYRIFITLRNLCKKVETLQSL